MRLTEYEKSVYVVCILKYAEDFGGRLSDYECLRKINNILGFVTMTDYMLAKRAIEAQGDEGVKEMQQYMPYDPVWGKIFNEI